MLENTKQNMQQPAAGNVAPRPACLGEKKFKGSNVSRAKKPWKPAPRQEKREKGKRQITKLVPQLNYRFSKVLKMPWKKGAHIPGLMSREITCKR